MPQNDDVTSGSGLLRTAALSGGGCNETSVSWRRSEETSIGGSVELVAPVTLLLKGSGLDGDVVEQNPYSKDRMCHGVQQKTNAPRMIDIVRSDFRALFSCLLAALRPPTAKTPTVVCKNVHKSDGRLNTTAAAGRQCVLF
jgi:hypothetical protein